MTATDVAQIGRRRLLWAGAAFVALAPLGYAQAAAKKYSIKVFKDPSCGCCSVWVDRQREAGFATTVEERTDMNAVKASLGVPADLASCHTAVAGGYTIEGHVPPADIKRLLATRPKALGLAVPGMPVNSPGMEVEGAPKAAYTVWLFQANGKRSTAFARYHG
jgi:hypothetical protein